MAPQPETRQTQRIDQVEEAVAGLRSSMMDEVAAAVNRAAHEMQQTLVAQITASLDQVTQKLQVRIDRARENNETLIEEVRKMQEDFQFEIRSTITSLKQNSTQQNGDYEAQGTRGEGSSSGLRNQTNGGFGFQGSYTRSKEGERPEGDPGGGGGGMVNNGGNWRYRKLDLPVFDGTNPDGWILRAERYFSFYRLNEEEKLEAAVVGFDGDALVWYQWENRRRPIRRWSELRELILQQFRPMHSGTLCEQWLAVVQNMPVQ